MKVKTTKKAITNEFSKVICANYCSVQHLFPQSWATAYTRGVYGWNADVYDGIFCGREFAAVVTGYRPFGNVQASAELCEKYDTAAMHLPFTGEQSEELRKLQREFIDAVLKTA